MELAKIREVNLQQSILKAECKNKVEKVIIQKISKVKILKKIACCYPYFVSISNL